MHQHSQSFPLIKCDRYLFIQKTSPDHQGKKSVIMNLFSIENVYMFPELTVGVVK